MRDSQRTPEGGFTLVELLVVIAIIGLVISLVLVASADGVRRAEERATQSLITKLESALNDRLEVLLNTQAPINLTHRYLARIGSSSADLDTYNRRAQVIAQVDFIRSELPDVFFRNAATSDGGTIAASYPVNFAAPPFPSGVTDLNNFVVPLGIGYNSVGGAGGLQEQSSTFGPVGPTNVTPVTGMFGASFSAASGIYKQLYMFNNPGGFKLQGVDGIDNNGNGYIDEAAEAGFTAEPASLANHKHKTARSEMLYAILVEGLGPLGSVFNRDEFTNREVADTDGDGLLEFIDAWGEPLQFYRWPIYYGTADGSSDSQKGSNPYNGFAETRQQNPMDMNQLLMAPGWWSGLSNPTLIPANNSYTPPNGTTGNQCGQPAIAFMDYFFSLVDPTPTTTPINRPEDATGWDRGGATNRRAYYSRFLIISGGPDKEVGVAQLDKDYVSLSGGASTVFPQAGLTMEQNARLLIYIENQAAQADPLTRTGPFYEFPNLSAPTTLYLQTNAALDDISNQNVLAPSTGVR